MNDNQITSQSNTAKASSHGWSLKTAIAVAAIFLLGSVAGELGWTESDLNAGTRPGKKREAFLSGGERSELVLKEIAATLVRIEKRVDQIEKQLSNRKQER